MTTHHPQFKGTHTKSTWTCTCGWQKTYNPNERTSPFGWKEAQADHPQADWPSFIAETRIA
jgi:hypothetical protein